MAATSGLGALATNNLAQDLLNHITPATTTATAITVTGPIKCHLHTAATTNTAIGTECADSNYAAQSVTWNAASTTAGAGYQVGFVARTNNGALTFGGAGGMNASQTITGITLQSSDATPIFVGYENYATSVVVGAGLQYIINNASLSFSLS